jgi:hypothetical protein
MIAAAGGVVLIISLFLDWISGVTLQYAGVSLSSGGATAFDAFSAMDIIMLLIGIAAIALAAISASGASVNLPFDLALAIALLGVMTFGWVVGWDLEIPNAGIGAWLALLAAAAIAYGGFETMREARTAVAAV